MSTFVESFGNAEHEVLEFIEGAGGIPVIVLDATFSRPRFEDFVFEQFEIEYNKRTSMLYYGECGDFRAFYIDAFNEGGYDGQEFTFKLKDGSEEVVKGPWGSRCGVVNNEVPHHIIEVRVNELQCYMDVGILSEIAADHNYETFVEYAFGAEKYYKVRRPISD